MMTTIIIMICILKIKISSLVLGRVMIIKVIYESDNDADGVNGFDKIYTNTNVILKNARGIDFNNKKSRKDIITKEIQHVYNN